METFQRPIEWDQELKGEEENLRKREKKVRTNLGRKVE